MGQVPDPRRSPCFYCERHGKSKTECALICDKLSAFVNSQDWRKYRVPSPAQMEEFSQYQREESTVSEAMEKLEHIFKGPG